MYFQSQKDSKLTISALFSLLYSIIFLSNATKNQKDLFARLTQSFSSKLSHSLVLLYLAFTKNSLLELVLGSVFGLDAVLGIIILVQVFSVSNEVDQ